MSAVAAIHQPRSWLQVARGWSWPPPESPPVATDCGLAVWSLAACPGMFQPHPPGDAGSKTGSRCRFSLGRSSRPVLAGCLWWCWWR